MNFPIDCSRKGKTSSQFGCDGVEGLHIWTSLSSFEVQWVMKQRDSHLLYTHWLRCKGLSWRIGNWNKPYANWRLCKACTRSSWMTWICMAMVCRAHAISVQEEMKGSFKHQVHYMPANKCPDCIDAEGTEKKGSRIEPDCVKQWDAQ